MKLYDTPKLTNIRVIGNVQVPPDSVRPEAGEVLKFHYLDGMYSVCTNKENINVFPAAWTEVEIV